MAKYCFYITISLLLFAVACGNEGKPNPTAVNGDTGVVHSQVKHLAVDSAKINRGGVVPEDLLESFNYCRESAENTLQCKFFIAKAIEEYYGVSDFKVNDEYIDYEKIKDAVETSPQWTKLGAASDQNVLNAAQKNANEGKAVLAIKTDEEYGHVVLILPGQLEKAPSWEGLSCPKVASFFMIPSLQPFVNRSIAYAWKNPTGIFIYARK